MSESLRVVRVFLASPGDLASERRIAKATVDEINSIWGASLGYHVDLVGWEDTVSSFGRPQAIINRDLEQCEYFIGMMWTRWGTPPDHGGPYTSGFEEEFEQTIARRDASSRPEVSLFFKKISDDLLRDPGDDLKKVLHFREKINNSKKVLYEVFEDEVDFANRVRRCISRYLQRLRDMERASQESPKLDPPKAVDGNSAGAGRDPLLSGEAAAFLKQVVDVAARGDEIDAISPFQVARFRLRSRALQSPANDVRFLGPHDANILFLDRNAVDYDASEVQGLLECGFIHCDGENVPIWHWLNCWSGFKDNRLPMHSLFGAPRKRAGAIKVMNLLGQTISFTPEFDRRQIVEGWLLRNKDISVKQQALRYLATWGVADDLSAVQAELKLDDYQTRNQAAEAIVSINLRDSRARAINALFELQPASLERSLIDQIFQNSDEIESDTLIKGLSHRNPEIRGICISILRKRNELALDQADQLMADNNPKVRFEAFNAAISLGRSFSNEEAKSILVKPVGGLFGSSDEAGERNYDEFVEDRLRRLPNEALKTLVQSASIFDSSAYFALIHQEYPAGGGVRLREALADQFASYFDAALERMKIRLGAENDTVVKTKQLRDYMRKELTRKGLDIISGKMEARDLGLLRKTLQTGLITYSDLDLAYLKKFGEWDDIKLVRDLIYQPSQNSTILGSGRSYAFSHAANTIYHLGKERLSELMALSFSNQLQTALVLATPLKAFRTLDDKTLLLLLQADSEQVRKAVALKSIRCFPKARLNHLLSLYASSASTTYYNVSHWIDLGCSMSSQAAFRAAGMELRALESQI